MSHIPPQKDPKVFFLVKRRFVVLAWGDLQPRTNSLFWCPLASPLGTAEWQRAVLTPCCLLQAVQRWGRPVTETYPQRHPPAQSARVQAPRHCPAHEEPSLEFCPLILYHLCAKGNGLGRSLILWSVEVKRLPLERLLWRQGCPRALGVEAKPSTGEGHLV